MNKLETLNSLNTLQLKKITRLLLHTSIRNINFTKEELVKMLNTNEADDEARKRYGNNGVIALIEAYSKNNGTWNQTEEEAKSIEIERLERNELLFLKIAKMIREIREEKVTTHFVVQELRKWQKKAEEDDNSQLEEMLELIIDFI